MSDTNTQVAQRPKQEIETVKSLLSMEAYKKRFAEVLGRRAPQFMASVVNLSNSQGLRDAEPKSVIGAAFVAATLDLPVDKNLGFAHVIAYRDNKQGGRKVASLQLGFKAFIQLGLRSGQYLAMNDFKVNKEAFISFNPVTGELKLDAEKLSEDGEIVGYAFYYKLMTGFEKTTYWPKSKVESHAKKYSRSFSDKSSPWQTQFDAMALKTVIANTLRKYGLLSVEMRSALKFDQATIKDIDAEPSYTDAPMDFGDDNGDSGSPPTGETKHGKKKEEKTDDKGKTIDLPPADVKVEGKKTDDKPSDEGALNDNIKTGYSLMASDDLKTLKSEFGLEGIAVENMLALELDERKKLAARMSVLVDKRNA